MFGTHNALPNMPPNWNTAPSQKALVMRRQPQTGERHLDPLQWGLLPSWTKDSEGRAEADQRPGRDRGEAAHVSGRLRQAQGDRAGAGVLRVEA